MTLWGFGGKEAWYTVTEATLKSIVKPVWETVSSTDNLKVAGNAAVNMVMKHPLTAAATVAVGVATYVAYKRKGFGIGLGQFNANFDNFLANASVRIGLGRKKPHEVADLDQRMSHLERGMVEAINREQRHHETNLTAIQNLREALLRRFETVTGTLETNAHLARANHKILVGNHTALLQQMGTNQTQLVDGIKAVVGETSQMNNHLARINP